jgi:hypothetical protein
MEHLQQLAAWHVAHVLNMFAKKGQSISPAKLLGKSKPITDIDQFAKEAAETWFASEEAE